MTIFADTVVYVSLSQAVIDFLKRDEKREASAKYWPPGHLAVFGEGFQSMEP